MTNFKRKLKDESTESKVFGFGSRFVEKSKRKSLVEFFNAKREKTKIKSKANLISNSKMKSNVKARVIRRKTRILTQDIARNDAIDSRSKAFHSTILKTIVGIQERISSYSLHKISL